MKRYDKARKIMKEGKLVSEFPILHDGWELDNVGYVYEDNFGCYNIIFTDHGSPYIPNLLELENKIKLYKEASDKLKEAMKLVESKEVWDNIYNKT